MSIIKSLLSVATLATSGAYTYTHMTPDASAAEGANISQVVGGMNLGELLGGTSEEEASKTIDFTSFVTDRFPGLGEELAKATGGAKGALGKSKSKAKEKPKVCTPMCTLCASYNESTVCASIEHQGDKQQAEVDAFASMCDKPQWADMGLSAEQCATNKKVKISYRKCRTSCI